jgi:hypothetical protein
MEGSGVYWKPVFNTLEEGRFKNEKTFAKAYCSSYIFNYWFFSDP